MGRVQGGTTGHKIFRSIARNMQPSRHDARWCTVENVLLKYFYQTNSSATMKISYKKFQH